MLEGRDAVLERAEGTEIDWKPGKNVSPLGGQGQGVCGCRGGDWGLERGAEWGAPRSTGSHGRT
jgi:hypothetical protein